MGHKIAAQQVRAVIESLGRAGSTPVDTGDAKLDSRTASISNGEGEALR